MTSYSDKLKDPRWQKMRLKVLERDGFICQGCCDTETTLHVHHNIYEYGKDPWEYDIKDLITLCESCHEDEKENCQKVNKDIARYLRRFGLKTFNLLDIIEYIGGIQIGMPDREMLSEVIIQYAINEDFREKCLQNLRNLKKGE